MTLRPPAGLSRRSAILMALILAILVMLAPVLRAFVAQQQQLGDLHRSVAATQEQADALQAQLDRWNDNAYVKAQARARFGYVMPGETGYIALGVPPSAATQADPSGAAARSASSSSSPWFSKLWGSVQAADQQPNP